MDTHSLAPAKKMPTAPQYNIKPPVPKSADPPDAPPLRKKYRPLNTPCNSAKEIKVKLIPAQRSFQVALDSAPVPKIWRKNKKASAGTTPTTKAVSHAANQESPFDRMRFASSFERPGTPFPWMTVRSRTRWP